MEFGHRYIEYEVGALSYKSVQLVNKPIHSGYTSAIPVMFTNLAINWGPPVLVELRNRAKEIARSEKSRQLRLARSPGLEVEG